MELNTQHLILRPWQEKDSEDLMTGLNDFQVSKWLAYIPYPYTLKDAKRWIDYCQNSGEDNESSTYYEFAIVLKKKNKVIGGTGLDLIDLNQGISGGGGIWLNRKYHGLGYGKEAFGKRIEFAFKDLGLSKLENGFFPGNEASWRMQESFGYKIETLIKEKYLCLADGKLKDEYHTVLLLKDWIF